MQYSDEHLRYLRLLSQKYQTVAAAASEIIRIEALLRLPKGTEHFMSDLHGEHEAFVHILNSASGVIREKNRHGAWQRCPPPRSVPSWRRSSIIPIRSCPS